MGQPVPEETAKTIVDILEKEVSERLAVQSDGREVITSAVKLVRRKTRYQTWRLSHLTDNTLRRYWFRPCRGSKICSSCRY